MVLSVCGQIDGIFKNTIVKIPSEAGSVDAFDSDVQAAIKLEQEHKAKELIVNQQITEEVNTESTRFKEVQKEQQQ